MRWENRRFRAAFFFPLMKGMQSRNNGKMVKLVEFAVVKGMQPAILRADEGNAVRNNEKMVKPVKLVKCKN